MKRDAERNIYICAVTLEHVQFIGPFWSEYDAGVWGHTNLGNPCWNIVSLFSNEVTMPLELVAP